MTTSQQEIIIFLNKFKVLVTQRRLSFVPRRDISKTFVSLGITENIATQELLKLSVVDFSKGPVPDNDRPDQNLWIFKKEIDGKQAYIKLLIFSVDGNEYAKCISFHIDK